jgi:hypothetical protein
MTAPTRQRRFLLFQESGVPRALATEKPHLFSHAACWFDAVTTLADGRQHAHPR